jgi:hypothetical protein
MFKSVIIVTGLCSINAFPFGFAQAVRHFSVDPVQKKANLGWIGQNSDHRSTFPAIKDRGLL